jgi:hypothetical protein
MFFGGKNISCNQPFMEMAMFGKEIPRPGPQTPIVLPLLIGAALAEGHAEAQTATDDIEPSERLFDDRLDAQTEYGFKYILGDKS